MFEIMINQSIKRIMYILDYVDSITKMPISLQHSRWEEEEEEEEAGV